MRTMSINMMGNKLIWQSLAYKKQKDRPAIGIYANIRMCRVVVSFAKRSYSNMYKI